MDTTARRPGLLARMLRVHAGTLWPAPANYLKGLR